MRHMWRIGCPILNRYSKFLPVSTAILTSQLRASMRSVALARCGGAGGKLSLWLNSIEIVVIRHRDTGGRVQREFWKVRVESDSKRVTEMTQSEVSTEA